jgi:putative Holliday junction resolvase
MAIVEMIDLRTTVKRGKRLLGLDLGSKTIGIAISDSGFMIASPLETIQRKKFTGDALTLKAIIDERQIGGLVLGLPKNMDGSDGPRVQSTRQFATNLLERFDIPIAFWDERLSTMAVERVLVIEADMSRQKRSAVIDKMAASYILQGALDLMAS